MLMPGQSKGKSFGTPHEQNVGFDVVEDFRLVPDVLPREEHDGVIGRHGSCRTGVRWPGKLANRILHPHPR